MTHFCVFWQAMQPRQKPMLLSLRLMTSTVFPEDLAPSAKAAAKASELLFARRLEVMTKTVLFMSSSPFADLGTSSAVLVCCFELSPASGSSKMLLLTDGTGIPARGLLILITSVVITASTSYQARYASFAALSPTTMLLAARKRPYYRTDS